jgi:integration host factor subunit beta
MIRSQLVTRLAAQNPHLYRKDCEAALTAILNRIADAIAAGDRVEIRNFGAFSAKEMRSRKGRNPRTGETVAVAQKKVVHFMPGKEMRQRVNAGAGSRDALPVLCLAV